MARRKYVVGNWKMNGLSGAVADAASIFGAADDYRDVDVAICPPFTLIGAMVAADPRHIVGGQDCHSATAGAYTGSIAASMLIDCGAKLVIVGHSERREGCGETDAEVKAKAETALGAGLNVILCVGEPRAVRDSGRAVAHVLAQITESLPDAIDPVRLTIAYEPIWAVGTGLVPTASDITAMHCAIRALLSERIGDGAEKMRILYGGSVTGDNAAELLGAKDVDGALVGGASLTATKFVPIIAAAASLAP